MQVVPEMLLSFPGLEISVICLFQCPQRATELLKNVPSMQLYQKRDSGTGVSCKFCEIFNALLQAISEGLLLNL